MAVTTDIIRTWRSPRAMFGRLLRAGVREDRLIAHLMGACLIMFVAQLPVLARIAHLSRGGEVELELDQLIGTAFFAWLMFMPLVFYLLAGLLFLGLKLLRMKVDGYSVRLSLFWGLLCASPVALLLGLMTGFSGQQPGTVLIFIVWAVALLVFVVQGLREAGSGAGTGADTKPEAGHAA
jgi:hypothetical protein